MINTANSMTKKERIDRILKESHLVINNATGLDISKTKKEEAKRESRKILKKLKDLAPQIYERIKPEL